jgi:DNA-binding GntR family transcriptional regulator
MATTEMSNQKLIAYEELKKRILNCEILPGEPINEKSLMTELNIGRTPIREALIALRTEKLVDATPRQGTYASYITEKDVREIYDLRKIMETDIAVNCQKTIDLSSLLMLDKEMKKLCECKQYNAKEFYDLDIEFHKFIVQSSNNDWIIATMEPFLKMTYRIGMLNSLSNTENRPETTYSQHHQIIEGIMKENSDVIRDNYIMHLNSGLLSALTSLKRSNADE